MRVAALLALAALTRAVVAQRTHVPARDSEAYLWMAERIAGGDFGAAFQTVFHPLYSVLVAPWIAWTALSPVAAGQLVACGLGALAILPLHAAARRLFGDRSADVAALLYAVGIWFVRHPADCLSEGPFFLVVATAACVVTRTGLSTRDAIALGVLSGIGYAIRPEGLAIGIVTAAWFARRRAWYEAGAVTLTTTATVLPWTWGWAAYGHGFTLTPKADFNWQQGLGGATSGVGHYLEHAVALPGIAFEAIGYLALPLAVFGWWRARPLRSSSPAAALLAMFALQCLVVPGLRSNIRFLAGYGLLLLPFAGFGATRLWRAMPRKNAFAAFLFGLVLVGGDIVRLPRERRADRVVLVELGRHLRTLLRPGDVLVTEMPRLAYFAGQPPIPPRPIHRDEILELARKDAARIVAIVADRTAVSADDLEPLGFAPLELPDGVRELTDRRGILVLARPE